MAKERVELIDPIGDLRSIAGVAIVLPLRDRTQVELSRTDCFALGLKNVPIRLSGDLDGSTGVIIATNRNEVEIKSGVIVARRHVHLDLKTAAALGVKNGESVSLLFRSERSGRLDDVVARVSANYKPAVHIDCDEANAVGFGGGDVLVQKTQ